MCANKTLFVTVNVAVMTRFAPWWYYNSCSFEMRGFKWQNEKAKKVVHLNSSKVFMDLNTRGHKMILLSQGFLVN